MVPDVSAFAVDRVLRDGGSIHVRAIRADDKARLIDHFARLSARSVYFRFFGVKKRLTEEELARFTELDFSRRVGLVATLQAAEGEQIIGVGRYAVLDGAEGQPRRAEVAFAIADDHQRRGIGAVLLEHLAEIARANGVEEFEADVLGENNSMLQVFLRSGFRVTRALEEGVFHLSFPTEETADSIAVQQRRDRAAAAASVRGFLQPRAVAVVGASSRPGVLGGALVEQLQRGGFRGPIYPVHPSAEAVAGLPAFARVSDIGAPVDLAFIAVPAAAVEEVVADCARAGVHAVVVVSGGFAETGEAGRAAEHRLAALVRASGMRLVGPASMGVMNTDPAISLHATAEVGGITPGPVGLLSQSGAIGLALLERCARLGIGLSSFVSVGNKADVSGNDLLAYWGEDPRTTAVLLYLESFGNPRKFAQLAPTVARQKPIVAVKAGRAPAHLDIGVGALFEQAGVIRTDSLEGLFDVAVLLASQPVPAGSRVAVVTNAAGLGAIFAAAAAGDLTLPPLGPAARAVLPAGAEPANPVDLLATARPEHYTAALTALGADPTVDAVVAIFVSPRGRLPAYDFPAIAAHALAAAAR